MLLKDKVAVIQGGGGAIGGTVARTFAREGAQVFLAGRTKAKLDAVANDIREAGGKADVAVVDARDEAAVNAHADAVVEKTGRIDVTLNAVGIMHVQGLGLAELSTEQFMTPVDGCVRTNFITAKAAARHMAKLGGGVILTLSTPGSRISGKGFLGYGVACGAVETLTRILAGELGEQGVRVVCLRPDAIPDALPLSYAREVFGAVAIRFGTTPEAMLVEHAKSSTLLKRLPRLQEVAEYAAFIASDRAGATTGAIANLTCGSVLD